MSDYKCKQCDRPVFTSTRELCYKCEIDNLRAENARLREELAQRWRPIESAPRDGTHFLAYSTYKYEPEVYECWFDKKEERFMLEECQEDKWAIPRFWQPIPAPPQDERARNIKDSDPDHPQNWE